MLRFLKINELLDGLVHARGEKIAIFGKIIVRMIAIFLFMVGLCIPALMQYLDKYGPEWCLYTDNGVRCLGIGFGITLFFL